MIFQKKNNKKIRFDKPSSWWGAMWRGGLPLGNGKTGACVYGGAGNDTVMLTSATSLWQGNIGVLPDVSGKIKEVRKLLNEGKYREAQNLIPDALIAKNYRPQTAYPLPVCDFNIEMPLEHPPREYFRSLNMENGEATVSYRDASLKIERKMFVSRADDLFVMEISKSGSGTINAQFSFDLHDKSCARTPSGVNSKLPEAATAKYSQFFMFFAARADNGTDFGAVARINFYGGTQEVKDNCLTVKGANRVLALVKVFTESQREKEWQKIKEELALNKLSYDKILGQHEKLHSKLFSSAEIDLRAEDQKGAEELLNEAYRQSAPAALIEKLWQYGRYLFISSALEEGSLIVRPYGLWCGDYKAPASYPDFCGKTQKMYRFALDNNLCQMILPLLNYFESVVPDLKKNAQRLFNCRGIFIPARVCDGTGLLGSVEPQDIHYIAATAEIANLFYDYCRYAKNKKYLKENALPFIREAVTFYEDFLAEENGVYASYPSYAPQSCISNCQRGNIKIAKNSESDFAAVRKLLDNLIEGAQSCKLYSGHIEKWRRMRDKLPMPKISEFGECVCEFNTDGLRENFKQGYLYSLFSVYPYAQKEITDNAEYKKAFLNSIKRRVTEGMPSLKCHTLAYLANAAARLDAPETAIELISHAAKSCVMDNLVTADNDWRNMGMTDNDAWANYDIVGNTSLSAAITTLFIYSQNDDIYISPSGRLFRNGSIKGILTESGVEADVHWDAKKGIKISLKAKQNCSVNVILPRYCRKITGVQKMDNNKVISNLELQGGKITAIEIKT